MKKLLISLALVASPFLAHAQVSASINIGEPGFYGQINLGSMAPPPVEYATPVVVTPGPVEGPPIYLRVPPDHHKNWARYCHEYNACGRKVFFVKDDWYRNTYAPHYKNEHQHDHDYDHREDHEHHDEHHEEH